MRGLRLSRLGSVYHDCVPLRAAFIDIMASASLVVTGVYIDNDRGRDDDGLE